jgi:hypothetical protein
VAQLVEALCNKPEGCGFISQWGHWLSHLLNPSSHTMAMVSTQPVTEYQGYLLGDLGSQCVRLATLPPSCANCLEILGASTVWSPKGLSRPARG